MPLSKKSSLVKASGKANGSDSSRFFTPLIILYHITDDAESGKEKLKEAEQSKNIPKYSAEEMGILL